MSPLPARPVSPRASTSQISHSSSRPPLNLSLPKIPTIVKTLPKAGLPERPPLTWGRGKDAPLPDATVEREEGEEEEDSLPASTSRRLGGGSSRRDDSRERERSWDTGRGRREEEDRDRRHRSYDRRDRSRDMYDSGRRAAPARDRGRSRSRSWSRSRSRSRSRSLSRNRGARYQDSRSPVRRRTSYGRRSPSPVRRSRSPIRRREGGVVYPGMRPISAEPDKSRAGDVDGPKPGSSSPAGKPTKRNCFQRRSLLVLCSSISIAISG